VPSTIYNATHKKTKPPLDDVACSQAQELNIMV